jgi:hypothetical protein
MTVDFHADVRRIFLDHLKANADSEVHRHLHNMPDYELVACYLNWSGRLIRPQPRHLIESKEFAITKQQPMDTMAVPKLLSKIQNGDDLLPHLSKSVKAVYTEHATPKSLSKRPHLDLLLSHWGIHHRNCSPRATAAAPDIGLVR